MTVVGTSTVVAATLLPFVLPDYVLFQASLALTYAIAILGLNLVMGLSGQISIGHGAFFAIGGYTAAILMDHYDVPYWLTILPAGLAGFGVGFLFGYPALRLEGFYLALATFSLALVTPQLLKHHAVETWTGGVQGIALIKPDSPISFINADQWLYLLCLGVAVCLFLFALCLKQSRIGRALIAARDNQIAAEAMGIDANRLKTITFGFSAAYTAIAGALAAILVQYVSPDTYGLFLSISLKVGVVVGGLGSIVGPVFGALFIQFVPNLADQISKAAPWAVYGLCLLLVVYAMPRGVAGALQTLLEMIVHFIGRNKHAE